MIELRVFHFCPLSRKKKKFEILEITDHLLCLGTVGLLKICKFPFFLLPTPFCQRHLLANEKKFPDVFKNKKFKFPLLVTWPSASLRVFSHFSAFAILSLKNLFSKCFGVSLRYKYSFRRNHTDCVLRSL